MKNGKLDQELLSRPEFSLMNLAATGSDEVPPKPSRVMPMPKASKLAKVSEKARAKPTPKKKPKPKPVPSY